MSTGFSRLGYKNFFQFPLGLQFGGRMGVLLDTLHPVSTAHHFRVDSTDPRDNAPPAVDCHGDRTREARLDRLSCSCGRLLGVQNSVGQTGSFYLPGYLIRW